MAHNLAHHLNKMVVVCVPSVFGDKQPRRCKLKSIEASGLWLESEDLADILSRDDKKSASPTSLTAFVPFHQITYLWDGMTPTNPAVEPLKTPLQGGRSSDVGSAAASSQRDDKTRPARRK